jgi:hypothetical protein
MKLTWRQAAAWLEFGDKLDCIERANALIVTYTGAQGKWEAVDKMLKNLSG